MWPCSTTLNNSHKTESETAPLSLVSKKSEILAEVESWNALSEFWEGLDFQLYEGVWRLKLIWTERGAWSDTRILWYVELSVCEISLEATKKWSILVKVPCTGEKKEYCLSKGCRSLQMSTKSNEFTKSLRTGTDFNGGAALVEDLFNWESNSS